METHKDKWMKHFQTLTPNSFNIKLNHPQNTVLIDRLVGWMFYGISILVGYLILNPVFIYIYIYI